MTDTALSHFSGPFAAWPPPLAAKLPRRLEQIAGRPGTYPLAAGRRRPACDVCGHRVRVDLHDGSTLHEAKPAPGVTVYARLCRECANAVGIPETVVMLP